MCRLSQFRLAHTIDDLTRISEKIHDYLNVNIQISQKSSSFTAEDTSALGWKCQGLDELNQTDARGTNYETLLKLLKATYWLSATC
jgi:hypothetical protein